MRTHVRFRPRSSTFLTLLATKWWRDRKFSKTHIVPWTTNGIQKCHPRGSMNASDNRTARKHNNKYHTTNIIYDQNSMSKINKIITKSNSHQIKKGNNLTYSSLETIWDLTSMRLVDMSIKRAKKRSSKILRFLFWKQLLSLKSLKYLFKSPKEAIETCHYQMLNCANFQSQWDLRLLL